MSTMIHGNTTSTSTMTDMGQMLNTQHLMLMMLPTLINTITALLTGIITTVFSSAALGVIITYLMTLIYKVSNTKEPAELIVTQAQRVMNGGLRTDGDHHYNPDLILAVLEYLSDKDNNVHQARVNMDASRESRDDDDGENTNAARKTKLMRKFHIIPQSSYKYQGMEIVYNKEESFKTVKEDSVLSGINYTLSIRSQTKTFKQLQDFAWQCYLEWVDYHFPDGGRAVRKVFYQIDKMDEGRPVFKMYTYGVCTPEKAWNVIFLPERTMSTVSYTHLTLPTN